MWERRKGRAGKTWWRLMRMKQWWIASKKNITFFVGGLDQREWKPHFQERIGSLVLHNRRLGKSHSKKIHVIWFDAIFFSFFFLPLNVFIFCLHHFSLPCRSIVSLLPYPHLSNIWETLECRRKLLRESTWHSFKVPHWRCLIRVPGLATAPNTRGQLTPNRQQHTHSVIDWLRWSDEPQLIFPPF